MTKPALRPTGRELEAIAAIAVANIVLNRVVPPSLQIPASLAAAGSIVALAGRAGAGIDAQGLSPARAISGFGYGTAIALPIGGLLALGAVLPWTKRFYRDRSIVAAHPREAAYQMLLRIPLATAAGEELIFRSAFEAMLSLHRPRWQVAALSAPLFGLWHVLPAFDQMETNPAVLDVHQGSAQRRAGVVLATFAITAVAGLGLSLLRDRTRSVVTPIIVHAAVNMGGFAGGWLAARTRKPGQKLL